MPPTGTTGRRVGTACWVAAGAGALLLVVTGRHNGQSWLASYLFVWLFVLGLSLGSLAWSVVHNLTGGEWGLAIRPFLKAALQLTALSALLALPLLLGPAALLPWMHTAVGAPEAVAAAGQRWYLNSGFFYARAIAYFAIWLGLAWMLRGDRAAARQLNGRRAPLQAISAVGFVLFAVTTTFAAVDWIMSLTPQWRSTEFGLLIGVGQVLSTLAAAILCAKLQATTVDESLRRQFHDLGNLALSLVLVWAYLALMQFIIIWIEDLPEEIPWYLVRTRTSWSGLTWFMAVAHFALPFLILLSRGAKRAPAMLAAVAALLLLACLADSFWLVMPIFRPTGFALQWSDLGALLCIGGLWLGCLIFVIGRPDIERAAGGAYALRADEHGAERAG